MTEKERYNNIPVSTKLDEVFEKACERGRKKRTYDKMKALASVAAVVALTLTISNVPITYAALESVPVIGKVVRLLHIGEGGTTTDGVGVHNQMAENTLKIWFSQENEYKENTPYYNVNYKKAPNRVEILLSGVRDFNPNEFVEQAEKLEGVKRAYREVYLDDSAILLVVELQESVDYKIEEYKEPAYLELSLFKSTNNLKDNEEIFFLRSEAMEMGESTAILKEMYQLVDASVVRTESDNYILSIGAYANTEDAQKALEELNARGISDTVFTVDNCKAKDNPK